MDVIFFLIPVSAVFVIAMVWAFLWAVRTGQFDDLERRGRDLLFDDDGERNDIDR
jgi:cbb3-type cytochrome oxidase maturation protein